MLTPWESSASCSWWAETFPGVTRTVSIDIFDRVQASDYAAANETALLLLAFSFAVLAIVYGLNRKAWVIGPVK